MNNKLDFYFLTLSFLILLPFVIRVIYHRLKEKREKKNIYTISENSEPDWVEYKIAEQANEFIKNEVKNYRWFYENTRTIELGNQRYSECLKIAIKEAIRYLPSEVNKEYVKERIKERWEWSLNDKTFVKNIL